MTLQNKKNEYKNHTVFHGGVNFPKLPEIVGDGWWVSKKEY